MSIEFVDVTHIMVSNGKSVGIGIGNTFTGDIGNAITNTFSVLLKTLEFSSCDSHRVT
jgi:hypothetical protein